MRDTTTQSTMSEAYALRFGGAARLYGQKALQRLQQAHFAVIGLGGVGSWSAEALARSGVGKITLIDMDEVCITNTNRQIHALSSTTGNAKIEVLAERLKAINPEIQLTLHEEFIDKTNIQSLITKELDVVIDAIDAAYIKAALIAYCSAIKLRLISCGSSGGKLDPTKIEITDLAFTQSDPIFAKIRTALYKQYNFSRDKKRKFRVDAVYSKEQMIYPKPDGSICTRKQTLEAGVKLDCTGGFGSSTMVTGSFGFIAAARAIERYIAGQT